MNGPLHLRSDASARAVDDGGLEPVDYWRRRRNLTAQRDGLGTTVTETRSLLARLDAALADFDAAW